MEVKANNIDNDFAAFQALREKTRQRLQTQDLAKNALQAVQQKKSELQMQSLGNISGAIQIKKLAYPESAPKLGAAVGYSNVMGKNRAEADKDFSPRKLGQFVDIMV